MQVSSHFVTFIIHIWLNSWLKLLDHSTRLVAIQQMWSFWTTIKKNIQFNTCNYWSASYLLCTIILWCKLRFMPIQVHPNKVSQDCNVICTSLLLPIMQGSLLAMWQKYISSTISAGLRPRIREMAIVMTEYMSWHWLTQLPVETLSQR